MVAKIIACLSLVLVLAGCDMTTSLNTPLIAWRANIAIQNNYGGASSNAVSSTNGTNGGGDVKVPASLTK